VLGDILKIMRAGKTRINLVFLDSCRDNPFSVGTKSATRGLIKEEPPSGTWIAYATQYGRTADDNPGSRNGVFTGQLLQHIGTPNITVEQMFKLVAAGVVSATSNREKQQEPWPEGFLYGDFYFSKVLSSAQGIQSPAWQGKPAIQSNGNSRSDKIIKDCDVCPELVVLPRGSFMMGSPETEPGRLVNEGPVHQVMIDYDLAVGRFEVTQGQWRQIMGSNPSQFQDCGEDCPVEKVSWNEVQAYIRKLNERSGKSFRLLSEAEWEYAARAGTTTSFSVGSVVEVHQANFDGSESYNGRSIRQTRENTQQVGGFEPNAFGLYDMHGNVWELVQDLYHHDYGGAPTNGSAWESGEQKDRVLRGGSWSSAPKSLRSAGRSRAAPDSRSGLTGFRVARLL
jgi:formylglycine-generating enzyme required for sulfatase activity